MDTDALSTLLRFVCEAQRASSLEVVLASGEVKFGSVHQGWSGDLNWVGGAIDLTSAYKQLGYSLKSDWSSILLVLRPGSAKPAYFISRALMFGSTSSVYGFNRLSRCLWFLCCSLMSVSMTNFYDDFPVVEPKATSHSAKLALELFFKILGWHTASGDKALVFNKSFAVLGVQFDLSSINDGKFVISNKRSRVDELIEVANTLASKSRVSAASVRSFHGKMQFAKGQFAGNEFRHFLNFLSQICEGPEQCMVDSTFVLMMNHLVMLLSSSAPRVITVGNDKSPIIIFTDGASEGEQSLASSHFTGAVLFDTSSDFSIILEGEPPAALVSLWSELVGDQLICQIELFPILAVACMFRDRLFGRRVIVFIDNDSARHALVRINSHSCAVLGMVLTITEKLTHSFPWFSRVPSSSNPADLPSRKMTAQACKLLGITNVGVLAIDQQTIDLVCDRTNAGKSRKRPDTS
jgi:hypothetical protein